MEGQVAVHSNHPGFRGINQKFNHVTHFIAAVEIFAPIDHLEAWVAGFSACPNTKPPQKWSCTWTTSQLSKFSCQWFDPVASTGFVLHSQLAFPQLFKVCTDPMPASQERNRWPSCLALRSSIQVCWRRYPAPWPLVWKHESGVAALFHSSDLSQTTQVWQLSHSSS